MTREPLAGPTSWAAARGKGEINRMKAREILPVRVIVVFR
jgi:hypothetical protein